jgi:hypothetical protein
MDGSARFRLNVTDVAEAYQSTASSAQVWLLMRHETWRALGLWREVIMRPEFRPKQSSTLTREEQIKMCREMADGAEQLAGQQEGDVRRVYLHLARRWHDLAQP